MQAIIHNLLINAYKILLKKHLQDVSSETEKDGTKCRTPVTFLIHGVKNLNFARNISG